MRVNPFSGPMPSTPDTQSAAQSKQAFTELLDQTRSRGGERGGTVRQGRRPPKQQPPISPKPPKGGDPKPPKADDNPKPPKGGEDGPPRCGTPLPPTPVPVGPPEPAPPFCGTPPPKEPPKDPRYLGPPIMTTMAVGEEGGGPPICELPSPKPPIGVDPPRPMPPRPIECPGPSPGPIKRPPEMSTMALGEEGPMPIMDGAKDGEPKGISARGPFLIEDPAPTRPEMFAAAKTVKDAAE